MEEEKVQEHEEFTEEFNPGEFLTKLRRALTRDGDFPASAKVVNQLKELTNNPRTTAQQMAEVILREPSLSARILHLVNSSFYRRAKPIMTISQAVVAIGMKAIADLCAGLVLIQRFVPLARRGGAFAESLQKAVVTSLLSSSFSDEIGGTGETKGNELGFISGFFSEIGTLLLAYYFPKLYESAVKRAELKNITIGQSLAQLTGHTPQQISIEVIRALGLPPFYEEVLKASQDSKRLQADARSLEEQKVVVAGKSVGAGFIVSSALQNGTKETVDAALSQVATLVTVDTQTLTSIVGNLPTLYKDYCSVAQLPLPSLPPFIEQYNPTITPVEIFTEEDDAKFTDFLEEIRQAVENREPPATIITTVMETLMFALGFERILLLFFENNRKQLRGRMALGDIPDFDPATFIKVVDEKGQTPYETALREGRVVYQGESILQDGWPLVVIPVGTFKKGVGVIYADFKDKDIEINDRTKASIGLISDLIERVISGTK